MIIDTNDIDKAKDLIKKSTYPILIRAQNDIFNRKILEFGKIDYIVFPDSQKRKSNLRYIDSGFNSVLAKLAKKKDISVLIDIKDIRFISKKEKAQELEKIHGIINLCNKYRIKINILNYKDVKNSRPILHSLGYKQDF